MPELFEFITNEEARRFLDFIRAKRSGTRLSTINIFANDKKKEALKMIYFYCPSLTTYKKRFPELIFEYRKLLDKKEWHVIVTRKTTKR